MANGFNPDVLLRGAQLAPRDPLGSVARGFSLAERIREAPLLRKIKRAELEQSEQVIAANQRKQITGDLVDLANIAPEGVTEENFPLIAGRIRDRGLTIIDDQNLVNTPQNIQLLNQAISEGSRIVGAKVTEAQQKASIDASKKFLEEERKIARDTVGNLKKRSNEIKADHGKILALADQMKTGGKKGEGSRAATGAAVQIVARLASPGIVTEKEAAAIAGQPTPGLALANAILEKGGSQEAAEAVAAAFDPLNPKLFDVDGLVKLAETLTASEAPVILSQLEEAQNRATTAGISQKAFDTNFGADNVTSITDLQQFVRTPAAPASGAAPAIDASQLSDEELFR